jgi:hypothetical protein
MAPFNMRYVQVLSVRKKEYFLNINSGILLARCTTCGEYIYRGKKFNARKEDVLGKTYLGIQVYRFYIKCTKCLAEITFLVNFIHLVRLVWFLSKMSNPFENISKTDPENQDYAMENGAMRNFESVRLAEKQADQEAKQEKEDEANNPMKLLENRTRDSRREMAILETLEDIKELNMKNINYDPLEIIRKEEMKLKEDYEEEIRRQLESDEREIKNIVMKQKLLRDDMDDDEDGAVTMKKIKVDLVTTMLSVCVFCRKTELNTGGCTGPQY